MKTHPTSRARLTSRLARVVCLLISLPLAASAAPRVWDGGGTDNNWMTPLNWNPNGIPQAGEDLHFPGGGDPMSKNNNNNFPIGTRFGKITFGASGYILGGNRVVLNGGIQDKSGGNTINFDITLGANQTFQCDVEGLTLEVTGDIDLGSSTLTKAGVGNLKLSGVVIGTGGLTMNSGVLTLTGNGGNTFSGYTRVNGGRLVLNKSAGPAIPSGSELVIGDGIGEEGADLVEERQDDQIGNGPITIYNSGALDLQGHNDTIGAIEFRNGGVVSTITSGSTGTLTLGGKVTAVFPNSLRSDTFAPRIEGKIQLSLYTGVPRTFDIADGPDSPDLELRAVIMDDTGITKTGAGALGLYADNTGYGGTVTVNGGLVYLYHNAALGDTSHGTVVNDGGVLVLWGDRSIGAEPLTLNGQGDGRSGALASGSGDNSWAGPITLATDADITVLPGSTLTLSGVISGPGGFTKAQRDASLLQTGTLRLSGAIGNKFLGDAWVQAGILELAKPGTPSSIPRTLHVGTSSGADHSVLARNLEDFEVGAVVVNRSGLYDLNGNNETVTNLTLNWGGDVRTGAGTLTLDGNLTVSQNPLVPRTTATISGKLDLHIGSRRFDVSTTTQPAGDPDLQIDAVVSGSADIIKEGPGLMALAAANTFSGDVTINAGTVRMTHASALGTTAGSTTVNTGAELALQGALNVGTEGLDFRSTGPGTPPTLSTSGGSSVWDGRISLAADAVFHVTTPLSLSGVISGAGGFAKEGTGILELRGVSPNTFTGDAQVNAGTLILNKSAGMLAVPGLLQVGTLSGAVGSVIAKNNTSEQVNAVAVRYSGTYDLNGYDETLTGDLSFQNGGRVQTGDGTLSFTGNGADVRVAHLPVGRHGMATIAGRLDMGNGMRAFNVDRSTPESAESTRLQVDAVVSGEAAIYKLGGGLVELAAANTFRGPMYVTAGTLRLTHNNALGTTAGGTTVNRGGELALDGFRTIGGEALTFGDAGTGSPGVLSADNGICIWHGDISLAADANMNVAAAALHLLGVISGPGGFTKEGTGRLQLAGTSANTYTGKVQVNAGTLDLNKTTGPAVPGDLFIGDGAGGAEADVVAVTREEQIHDAADVTIASSGSLQLNATDAVGEDIGTLNGSGVVRLGAGELHVGKNVACTYAGQIQGAGRFRKEGTASVTLTGNNTYTGLTTVHEGKLVVNGSQPASLIHVESGAVLGGNGTVGQITTVGRISPGPIPNQLTSDHPGVLTCGNLFFGGDSAKLAVELNGPTVGSDYDQMNARGGVTLNGHLDVKVGASLTEGDRFTIISNDGEDPIMPLAGDRFIGLPEGAVLTATAPNPLKFHITYRGGDGNDVALTVTNTALLRESVAVLMGNGNGVLDPNECNTLEIVLRNREAATATDIETVLTTTTPGVWITQAESPYPDLPSEATGTNSRPFQISMAPDFLCGTEVQLALRVQTAAHGSFTIRFQLPSGGPGTMRSYVGRAPDGSPMPGTGLPVMWALPVESPVLVADLPAPIAHAEVSCHITHARVGDLRLVLRAPDGTEIALSTHHGGAGDNYGSGCAENRRTYFSDSAAVSIADAGAPFIGRFRPETPLSAMHGWLGAGEWRLIVRDEDHNGVDGVLHCWTLHLYPAVCGDGGGHCLPCPNQEVRGTLVVSDPQTQQVLVQDGAASVCGTAKQCPGFHPLDVGRYRYHTYMFQNGAADACVTVELLQAGNGVYSVACTNQFLPDGPCLNYWADAGRTGPARYDFQVGARAVFTVVVAGPPLSDYTLRVSGGSCQPWINIAPTGDQRVVLSWPNFASDFHLEATNHVEILNRGLRVPDSVFGIGRDYVCTNAMTSPARFYQLHKP